MSFFDDVKKALSDFGTARAENDSENRKFYDTWEKTRKDRLLPLLEQVAALVNEQAQATDLTAEAKPQNGSISLKIFKSGKKELPIGSITIQAARRQIFYSAYVSDLDDTQSETFDLYTLDFSMLEAKLFSFISKTLEANAPKP